MPYHLLRALLKESVRRELQYTLLQVTPGSSLPQKRKVELITDIELHAHGNETVHADTCRFLLSLKTKRYIDWLIRDSGRRVRATTKSESINEFIRADADAQNEDADGRRDVGADVSSEDVC